MNYEIHRHTSCIEETFPILIDLYKAISQTTLDQITGEYDIDISIIPRPTAK